MSTIAETTTEFAEFCEFVALARKAEATRLTPEQILAQFRGDRDKWRRWYEGNVISMEQARRGEYGPLDLDEIMRRVRKRLAENGDAEQGVAE
jgi:hypothetical protein